MSGYRPIEYIVSKTNLVPRFALCSICSAKISIFEPEHLYVIQLTIIFDCPEGRIYIV